ncbi:MXAN_6640 family putative metalloprotease [Nocardioides sp. cx-173]|uniref:MXAN_6640 family putative metalloprotease n=1 Tax=Nocardioides sp. cx-173 TaxID=2898796 RepID=UPI001E3BDCCB|nr:MXAN_6640 family putative metalloprotease [Nocardioides sp. cx-173]MCD4527102.1 hypothetical protein [Nocardioides sp. cx-173]UGB42465.1 hypothetical protein LQ940_02825 [Nocardioides sp. cx-173]
MPPLHARRAPLPLLALVALVGLLATLLTAPSATARPDTTGRGKAAAAQPSAAERALTRAQQVLDGSRRGDATLALRDLALRLDELDAGDRAAAQRVLARPTGGKDEDSYGTNPVSTQCSDVVCVHWVQSGPEATTATYAQTTLATATAVHKRYVAAGYKAPKPDAGKGGNSLPDIYIANIGDRRLYGYCTTDEKRPFKAPWDRYAFCVVDNDYQASEFPTNTPLENLQVTVAHEYFHAVQYAYDFAEDGWLLEATAAWVEDELYDGVDDNRQYLAASPLRQPRKSMDQFDPATGYHYGVWIFFRYLGERFPASQGGLPTIVRDIFRRADGSGAARKDQYSWQAVSSVLRARKTTPEKIFTAFSAANRRPVKTYSEGAAYRKAPLAGKVQLAKRQVTRQVRLSHLSSATYRVTPGRALKGPKWKLRVSLDMAPTYRGSQAVITLYLKNGTQRVTTVKLNKQGDGRKAVAFARGKVSWAEVTLANASGRFACWKRTYFSCQGVAKDDRLQQRVTFRAVK